MTFGTTVRAWRRYRHLTEADLDALGIPWPALRYYENLTPGSAIFFQIQEIVRLAKALGVTVAQLVEGIGPRDTPDTMD